MKLGVHHSSQNQAPLKPFKSRSSVYHSNQDQALLKPLKLRSSVHHSSQDQASLKPFKSRREELDDFYSFLRVNTKYCTQIFK